MTESDQQGDSYVSIQADVRIDWHLLNEEEATEAATGFEQRSATIGLCSEIEYNKEALAPSIRKIKKDHPEIASWLSFLQQTVETLANQLSEQRFNQNGSHARRVSISASSIEFSTSQRCVVGDKMQMVLALQPSVPSIMVIGQVINTEQLPPSNTNDNACQLKVRFIHIRDSDQEMLIRHIHRAQIDELRAARAMRLEKSKGAV